VVHPEVLFQLADRLFGGTTPQPVVAVDVDSGGENRGDVGDHGEEPPTPEIVEAELFAGRLSLSAHEETEVALGEAVDALGHFGSGQLTVGLLGRNPQVFGSVARASIAMRTLEFCTQVIEKAAECLVAVSTTDLENPAESTRSHSW
jgi:hypothetical protein